MDQFIISETLLNKIKKRNYTKNSVLCETSKCKNDLELKCFLFYHQIKSSKCEKCNMEPLWNKKPIEFLIFRKNGNKMDNTLENIKILCPNCFSQESGKQKLYIDKNSRKFDNCIDCGKKFKRVIKKILLDPFSDITSDISSDSKIKYVKKRCDLCMAKNIET